MWVWHLGFCLGCKICLDLASGLWIEMIIAFHSQTAKLLQTLTLSPPWFIPSKAAHTICHLAKEGWWWGSNNNQCSCPDLSMAKQAKLAAGPSPLPSSIWTSSSILSSFIHLSESGIVAAKGEGAEAVWTDAKRKERTRWSFSMIMTWRTGKLSPIPVEFRFFVVDT